MYGQRVSPRLLGFHMGSLKVEHQGDRLPLERSSAPLILTSFLHCLCPVQYLEEKPQSTKELETNDSGSFFFFLFSCSFFFFFFCQLGSSCLMLYLVIMMETIHLNALSVSLFIFQKRNLSTAFRSTAFGNLSILRQRPLYRIGSSEDLSSLTPSLLSLPDF